jgi:hypothetical protein
MQWTEVTPNLRPVSDPVVLCSSLAFFHQKTAIRAIAQILFAHPLSARYAADRPNAAQRVCCRIDATLFCLFDVS